MITIFNRRELSIVFSMKDQSEIRRTLSANKIKYYLRTINRSSPSPFSGASRARTGSFGQKMDLNYEYVFYVHKKDYELAKNIIRK